MRREVGRRVATVVVAGGSVRLNFFCLPCVLREGFHSGYPCERRLIGAVNPSLAGSQHNPYADHHRLPTRVSTVAARLAIEIDISSPAGLVVGKVPIAGFLPSVVIVIAITVITITVIAMTLIAIMALAFVAATPVDIFFLATVGTAAGLDSSLHVVAQRLIPVTRETGPALRIQPQVPTRPSAAAPP